MSNLLDNLKGQVLSVPEYLEIINGLISPIRVSVVGEITDLKISRDWVFFSLKDKESPGVLRCGLHAGQYRKIGVSIDEGMEVRVLGYGKLAGKSGNFGFWVQEIEPIGEGALKKAYEILLNKLKEEGLFERKRELPNFIESIGVISSRNGVVVRDLMKNLRNIGYRVSFLHSGVEGAESAVELTKSIGYFNKLKNKPDVLVIIRGGGSLESLQGFNNESVARAIFASSIPTVVGIGHDVDVPIATLVADRSASTPTGVAHIINETWAPLFENLPMLERAIFSSFENELERKASRASLLIEKISSNISSIIYRFKDIENNLSKAVSHIENRINVIKQRLLGAENYLSAVSPERNLKLGYSILFDSKGKVIKNAKDVKVGDNIETKLIDGSLSSDVSKINLKKNG